MRVHFIVSWLLGISDAIVIHLKVNYYSTVS